MNIAGIQVNSFVDYDGYISFVVFTAGCNMNCWYCHNRDILNTKEYLNEDEVLASIKGHMPFIDAVVITGGEPTIQKDLIDFIKKIKKLGLKVKLDSNGKKPEVLQYIVDNKLVDYIAMDIKAPLDKYSEITMLPEIKEKYLRSIEIIKGSNIFYEFRTTFVPILSKLDIIKILESIKGADKFVLQQFRRHDKMLLDVNKSHSNDIFYEIKDIASEYVKECVLKI